MGSPPLEPFVHPVVHLRADDLGVPQPPPPPRRRKVVQGTLGCIEARRKWQYLMGVIEFDDRHHVAPRGELRLVLATPLRLDLGLLRQAPLVQLRAAVHVHLLGIRLVDEEEALGVPQRTSA